MNERNIRIFKIITVSEDVFKLAPEFAKTLSKVIISEVFSYWLEHLLQLVFCLNGLLSGENEYYVTLYEIWVLSMPSFINFNGLLSVTK